MSDTNIFLSNGTCYLAAGVEAHKAMIPCGNSYYYGPLACCEQGDVCLANNACYDAKEGVTYLAGCSDPEYQDVSCPDKGAFQDEPWVGLVHCDDPKGWKACAQSGSPGTLTKPDDCQCSSSPRTIAFSGGSPLEDRVRLGSALLESVVYYPGHAPTRRLTSGGATAATAATAPPATTTDTQVSSEETSATTPTPTSAPVETALGSSDTAKEEGLPAGVGIGIGVGVGSAVVLAVIGLLLFLRRRRRQQRDSGRAAGANAEKPDSAVVENLPPPQPPALGTPELDSHAARPWSMRSELPDTPRNVAAEMESPVQVPIHADNARHHARPPPSHPSLNGRPQNGPIAELP